jgi:hypothetical protein
LALSEQGRARVVYGMPAPRTIGSGLGLGAFRLLAFALVLFVGGVALGRLTAGGRQQAAAPAVPHPSATAAPRTAAAPQAAQPATAAATQAAVGRAGPTRVVNGVPVGYARSQAGAVAAATNFASLLSSRLIFDPARRHQAIATLAAPEARAALQRDFDQTVPLVAKSLRVSAGGSSADQVLLRAIPVGWHLDRYDGDRAQVRIWATGLGGSTRGVPVHEVWGVITIQLRWVDGDWKELSTATTDGPVPVADDTAPSSASVLVPQAQDFKEYDYAPGS